MPRMMNELAVFVRAYRMARGKKHGRGKAPIAEAINLARCSAYVAGGSRRHWVYPHTRAIRRFVAMKKYLVIAAVAAIAFFPLAPVFAQDPAEPVVVVDTAAETEAVPVDVGAGEVTEVVGEPSIVPAWWQALWKDVQGPVWALVPIVIGFFIKKYLGERAGQIAMEMLAAATTRGSGGVINELGDAVFTTILTPDNQAVKKQVAQIKMKMAETIVKTGATDKTIAENIINGVGLTIGGSGHMPPVGSKKVHG